MGPKQNLRATYDREYAAIEDDLLRIREMVDQAIDKSIQCLRNRDMALAQEIVDDDININNLRFQVEEACLRLIATQQPAATDLRAVVAVMRSCGWVMHHCLSR